MCVCATRLINSARTQTHTRKHTHTCVTKSANVCVWYGIKIHANETTRRTGVKPRFESRPYNTVRVGQGTRNHPHSHTHTLDAKNEERVFCHTHIPTNTHTLKDDLSCVCRHCCLFVPHHQHAAVWKPSHRRTRIICNDVLDQVSVVSRSHSGWAPRNSIRAKVCWGGRHVPAPRPHTH